MIPIFAALFCVVFANYNIEPYGNFWLSEYSDPIAFQSHLLSYDYNEDDYDNYDYFMGPVEQKKFRGIKLPNIFRGGPKRPKPIPTRRPPTRRPPTTRRSPTRVTKRPSTKRPTRRPTSGTIKMPKPTRAPCDPYTCMAPNMCILNRCIPPISPFLRCEYNQCPHPEVCKFGFCFKPSKSKTDAETYPENVEQEPSPVDETTNYPSDEQDYPDVEGPVETSDYGNEDAGDAGAYPDTETEIYPNN